MASGQSNVVLRHLRQAALAQDGASFTDGELLATFISWRDETAFRALLRRHGPMVLGVCRRVLRNEADAEDAFQATFLVLVRKAESVVPRERVGNWLYGVAYRTALKARSNARRRLAKERQAASLPRPEVDDSVLHLRELLDRELNRLPEKYRAPVILCDLEGRALKEVAGQLGWPQGTVASRLARARGLLASRLARHGLAIAGGTLSALAGGEALAAVPPALTVSTVKAAGEVSASAVVSARVAALVNGVATDMTLYKTILSTVAFLALGVFGAAAGALALPRPETPKHGPRPALVRLPAAPPDKAPDEKQALKTFQALYSLKNGEVLRRVPPPFPPGRMVYYRTEFADQARLIPKGPTAMYFRMVDGQLKNWGMMFSSDAGNDLASIINQLVQLPPQYLDGDAELRKAIVTGDFTVRAGAPVEQVMARLEEILRKQCKLPVKLTFREVERSVFVARGQFQLKPLPGQLENAVQIYGRQLVENSGAGGGGGNLPEFFKGLGEFIDRRIVSEATGAPKEPFSWHYHKRSPFTEAMRREDTDPQAVLKNVAAQTGLTFQEEKRKVRVLFVERSELPQDEK